MSLRTNPISASNWGIVRNTNDEIEFASPTFGEVIEELSRVRGRVLVLEDKRLVYTVRSSIDLDIIEMSRVADEGYNVSEREIAKLVANNDRNAYFVCVSMLLQPVFRESRIWNLINAMNGQVRRGNVSSIYLLLFSPLFYLMWVLNLAFIHVIYLILSMSLGCDLVLACFTA